MSRPVARRYGKHSAANVQAIQTIVQQVGARFVPKNDPFQELANEIEKCSRMIRKCVDEANEINRQSKKPRKERVEDPAAYIPADVSEPHHNCKHTDMNQVDFEAILNAMKYKEIQAECKKNGLNAAGTMVVLRERLLTHLMEQRGKDQDDMGRNDSATKQDEVMEVEEKPEQFKDSVQSDDVGMKGVSDNSALDEKMDPCPAPIVTVERAVVVQPADVVVKPAHVVVQPTDAVIQQSARVSSSSIEARYNEPMNELTDEEANGNMEGQIRKDPPGNFVSCKSIPIPVVNAMSSKEDVAVLSAMKSPLEGIVQSALKSISHSAKKIMEHPSDSIPEDDTSPPSSDITSSTASSRVRDIVSKFSNPYSSSSSALSKCVQEKNDARMARMVEMREKSQQAKINSSSKSVKASKELDSKPSNCLKKNLAAQMREKALRKENVPVNQIQASHMTTGSSAVKLGVQFYHATVSDSLGTTLKSGLGSSLKLSAKKFKAPSPPSAKKFKAPSPPKETYEISDREGSDSDDSEDESEKNKKQIPAWAKREQLVPALEAQCQGKGIHGERLDPDQIFSEVETCNLEAIFGKKNINQKHRNRTSSGNWDQDHVTAAEKLVYKRAMGFAG